MIEQKKQYKYTVTLQCPFEPGSYTREVVGTDDRVGDEWLRIVSSNGRFTSFAASHVIEYGREPVEQEQE